MSQTENFHSQLVYKQTLLMKVKVLGVTNSSIRETKASGYRMFETILDYISKSLRKVTEKRKNIVL